MTTVGDPPTEVTSSQSSTAADTAPEPSGQIWLERLARYAPLLLVAFAVAFSAWLLRAELRNVPFPNDATIHDAMSRFAERRIRAHRNPFDAWFPYLGLGVPQFSQYQSFPSIITGLLNIVFGGSVFRWINYLLICTWPITVYIGARLLGLQRWEAGAAALFSPMLVNVTGYGFEWGSFVWLGSGMWSMLWALWLLPLALGLAWRAVSEGERIALATLVVGLTCAFHFLTGYLVLLSLGVFVLVRPRQALIRLARSAVVGVGGLLIFSFVFVPTIFDLKYVNLDSYTRDTFWVNSYGPGKVMSWLFRGEVFDYGRFPVVSIFVALGVVACITRVRKSEVARLPLGFMILSLAMYSGRHVVGRIIDVLPGGKDLLLHRYIMGVHFAGMLLAGIGAVWVFRLFVKAAQSARIPDFSGRQVVAVGIACLLAMLVLKPMLVNRRNYASSNAYFVIRQAVSDRIYGHEAIALIDIAKQRGDGRVYAGASNNWGRETKVDQVPIYQLPAQMDADSIGFYLRTSSLSTDVEPSFNEFNAPEYDLFNVKYLVLPLSRKPTVPATVLARRGQYVLWQVNTSGYLEVVDATEPVQADRTNMAAVFVPYLSSIAAAQRRHPLVAFDGDETGIPSLAAASPYTGPPGAVDWSAPSLEDGRFTGQVTATRPAWVMLKESYYPRWTATVDGKSVKPQMLAPSFLGVPVPAGTHLVVFKYESSSSYPALIVFGMLVFLGIALAPWAWRRYRRPSSTMESAGDLPK